MYWDLVLITALWWVFIGAILTAAMYLGIRRSVARTGWVRRTWTQWIRGLVLIVVVFAAVFAPRRGSIRSGEPDARGTGRLGEHARCSPPRWPAGAGNGRMRSL